MYNIVYACLSAYLHVYIYNTYVCIHVIYIIIILICRFIHFIWYYNISLDWEKSTELVSKHIVNITSQITLIKLIIISLTQIKPH